MFFGKLSLAVLLVTVAALFSVQSVEAAKGPKITHKVYFDVKHGDKDMGRSTYLSLWPETAYLMVPL
jgi:peptidyl-prolyl cis-trans isomerase B (cyclophilin B)